MSLDSLAWTQISSPRNAPHENRELASKEPGHILEAIWPCNMEHLFTWKNSFSAAKSKVSSFQLSSVLLPEKHKLFPAVLDARSSYSRLVLIYFPGPNSFHFRESRCSKPSGERI